VFARNGVEVHLTTQLLVRVVSTRMQPTYIALSFLIRSECFQALMEHIKMVRISLHKCRPMPRHACKYKIDELDLFGTTRRRPDLMQ
jgi:hypothetical protein